MSTNNFEAFAARVNANWKEMSKHELFIADIDGDALFQTYLNAFPEGTNPIFRERTEHDCSCCKNFIRNIGRVICLEPGAPRTVWDGLDAEEGALGFYASVASGMEHEVMRRPIKSLFRTSEAKYGNQFNFEGEIKWDHFWGDIATKHRCTNPAEAIGKYASAVQVLTRGLTELKPEALATIIELIEAKALYRGEEHLAAVRNFAELQRAFMDHEESQDKFTWRNAHSPAALFRNTVIGTLAVDLSNGVDLERAVKAFEVKVAPANYKRPTALITPRMVEDAMSTIRDLGLESTLERRLARLSDVSINNVLWADNAAKSHMKDSIEGLLMEAAVSTAKPDLSKAEVISIDDFVANILPRATGMDLFLSNRHQGNLMTLTTPVHDDVQPLFKWDNNFGWSYNGNIADSELRKQVAARGGRIDGVFRFSHTWNYDKRNASLMDLHVFLPGHGGPHENRVLEAHHTYGNHERVGWDHRSHHASGGVQDVDYVAEAPAGYVPVENITFPDIDRMPEGQYVCMIHNWNLRSPTQGGFKAEIEFGGQLFEYEVTRPLKHKEWVKVATVTLKGGVFSIEHHLPCGSAAQDVWGVKTESLVRVSTVMKSPNHWDGNEVGNRHWFFMLDGCHTTEPMRGIYNEFLRPDLERHRKVFEVLGDKTKCQPDAEQMSGVGFSSTRSDKVVVSVTGPKLRKLYEINF